MRSTPQQTYLVERLQSARGLGWSMPVAALPFRKRRFVRPVSAEAGALLDLLRAGVGCLLSRVSSAPRRVVR